MHWSAYEVFSVISGLALLGMGFLPGTSGKDRARLMLMGAAFVVFGCYVASQDSGTYYFPVAIFVLPFAVAFYAGLKALDRRRSAPVRPAGGKEEQ
jgi:peptidoglycan/LPS O-acetylase OafA/YrhL